MFACRICFQPVKNGVSSCDHDQEAEGTLELLCPFCEMPVADDSDSCPSCSERTIGEEVVLLCASNHSVTKDTNFCPYCQEDLRGKSPNKQTIAEIRSSQDVNARDSRMMEEFQRGDGPSTGNASIGNINAPDVIIASGASLDISPTIDMGSQAPPSSGNPGVQAGQKATIGDVNANDMIVASNASVEISPTINTGSQAPPSTGNPAAQGDRDASIGGANFENTIIGPNSTLTYAPQINQISQNINAGRQLNMQEFPPTTGLFQAYRADIEGQPIVMKKLPEGYLAQQQLEQFIQSLEMPRYADTNAVGIAQYIGATLYEDKLYLLRDYCPGNTLGEFAMRGPLKDSSVLTLLNHLARVLTSGGESVHGALKPSNLFVSGSKLWIADFGMPEIEQFVVSESQLFLADPNNRAGLDGSNGRPSTADDVRNCGILGLMCLGALDPSDFSVYVLGDTPPSFQKYEETHGSAPAQALVNACTASAQGNVTRMLQFRGVLENIRTAPVGQPRGRRRRFVEVF